jgi:hypothetical protein
VAWAVVCRDSFVGSRNLPSQVLGLEDFCNWGEFKSDWRNCGGEI